MKSTTSITIESELLKRARQEIPNLSNWVNDKLKDHFQLSPTTDNITWEKYAQKEDIKAKFKTDPWFKQIFDRARAFPATREAIVKAIFNVKGLKMTVEELEEYLNESATG